MNPLRHVAAKLNAGKPVTIGYFGGNHVDGYGASEKDKTSWRALTTAWFKTTFPQSSIREVNGAITGTNSVYGMFRLENDLLMAHPDLIFIDFSAVDQSLDPHQSSFCLESIIRQILRNDANTDIVIILSANKWVSHFFTRNDPPRTILAHQIIAAHYKLMALSFGQHMWKIIKDGLSTWDNLTKDGSNYLDAGHDLCFQFIRTSLLPLVVIAQHTDADKPHKMPTAIHGDIVRHGEVVDAWDIAADGWFREEKPLAGRYPHQLVATTPESGLSFPFTGTTIGLWWLVAKDGGDIQWRIDDDKPKRLSSYDKHTEKGDRAVAVILRDNLEPGDHVLDIRVLLEKNDNSKGNTIRLGAFLVGS